MIHLALLISYYILFLYIAFTKMFCDKNISCPSDMNHLSSFIPFFSSTVFLFVAFFNIVFFFIGRVVIDFTGKRDWGTGDVVVGVRGIRSCWGRGKAWFLGSRRCGLGMGLGLKEEEIDSVLSFKGGRD